MKNYEFKLTPAYCLYNGAAVIEQNGSYIKFLIENDDELLRARLRRAFEKHVNYALSHPDCSANFTCVPDIVFTYGTRSELRKYVANLYEKKNFEDNGGQENCAENLNGEKNYKSIKDYKNLKNENGIPKNNILEAKKIEGSSIDEAAAVLLLDSILQEARIKGATDIHVEKNVVRFRVNGNLETEYVLQKERFEELVQRIKLLGDMNVLEKRKSQDGHFVYGSENPLFVRVSSVGIVGEEYSGGEESIVLRLLDTKRLPLSLEKLGFSDNQNVVLHRLCTEKNGLVVVCGPTGAGKTTTIASMLMKIQKDRFDTVKIVSLEDPPEYVIPGVTQIQIDEKQGRSFENALKYVFRQDPDVIMIGEIRDENSAETALRASLTGHLVFATVHAGSVEEVLLRLEDLGLKKEIIGAVLKGVVVQELNHVGNQVNLLADVAVFDVEKNIFEHETNFSDVVRKSVGEMYKGRSLPILVKNVESNFESSNEKKVVGER